MDLIQNKTSLSDIIHECNKYNHKHFDTKQSVIDLVKDYMSMTSEYSKKPKSKEDALNIIKHNYLNDAYLRKVC